MTPLRAAVLGTVAAALAATGPFALHRFGHGWLVQVFGPAAPAHAAVAGVCGALLAGATVGIVLAALRASQGVFLTAWGGTTLLRLAALAVLAVLPVGGGGATQGLLIGYVAAVVLGSVIEVALVWIAGGAVGARAGAAVGVAA